MPVSALGAGVTTHAVYFKDSRTRSTVGEVDGYKLALSKAFSKRTTTYVSYTNQKDSVAGSTANNATIYTVGMAHSF